MLESNYLTMLVKSNYEKPIDTAQDIIDRGLPNIYRPGAEEYIEGERNSSSEMLREEDMNNEKF